MRDEGVLELPEEWPAAPLARRDRPVTGVPAPDPSAPAVLAAIYAERPGLLPAALAHPKTDPVLAAADPDSPLGAAISAHVIRATDKTDAEKDRQKRLAPVLADAWLAGRGHVFAAEATVSLFDLRAVSTYGAPDHAVRGVERQYDGGLSFDWENGITLTTLYRVREALAAAPADVYADTVAALGRQFDPARPDALRTAVACAFLLPTETGWIRAITDAHVRDDHRYRGTIGTLLAAAAGPEDLERISRSTIDLGLLGGDPGRRLLPTVAARSGAALATMLRGIDWGPFVTVLGRLPHDEAFTELRNRAAERYVRDALADACARFPARATRLLAQGGNRRLQPDLLRGHVLAHPAVAATVLPGLTGEPAARVAALLDELSARTDAATVPDWPAFPGKTPPIPRLLTDGVLPPLLRDGTALPADRAPALLTAFALSRIGKPWAHLGEVTAAFDPDDLARYVWDVFFRWYFHGGGPRESWTLDALALAGTDDTVRRLTPTILAWPGESGHARAVAGLGVLAAIGTETALMALNRVAQRSSFKGLKTAARAKMDEVAAGLGLDGDQLADRLVPDFGLDPHGRTTVDYGTRAFTVGFDEKLTPYVTDAAGKRLKALPKPGAQDDPERAPAAQKRFAELKKEVRGVAGDLVARFERDMVGQRRVTGAEFTAYVAGHPLVRHLARRLVWGVYDDGGNLTGALRVAEDGTLTDADDKPVTLDGDARVGVAHPMHLAPALAAGFGEVFTDYEIVQPFPQLGRETYRLAEDEAAGRELSRLTGLTAPGGRIIALEKRGWLRARPEDAGAIHSVDRALPGGGAISVRLNPGMWVEDPSDHQTFDRVELWGRPRLGDVDPLLLSEIIRDLTLAAQE